MKRIKYLFFILIIITAYCGCTKKEKEEITLSVIIEEISTDQFSGKVYQEDSVNITVKSKLPSEYCIGDIVKITTDDLSNNECTALSIEPDEQAMLSQKCYKPVIYLYPEENMEVNVGLDFNGELLHTYPAYDNGWSVTAMPDGSLSDLEGSRYKYLFWDGQLDDSVKFDMGSGFCVKGFDSEEFLTEKLDYLGLNSKETEEFLEFWLPYLQENEYNIITFQTNAYTDNAILHINPEPDSLIRVYMVYKPSDKYVNIPQQELEEGIRSGFTVVEWGGSIEY